jgi:outer membrane protein TolC
MNVYLANTNEYGQPLQPELRWTEEEAVAIALTNRHSVLLAKWRLEDSHRSLKITEDQLRWDLSLSLGGKLGTSKSQGASASKERGYNAGLSSDLPWDRLSERNAYRTALIAIDAAERSFANLLDTTRQLIREDIRSINQAWSSFVIQSEALEVAQRRVRSTTLFQQAGKSSTRDLLEAEAALLTTRNSYVDAIVTYRMADLKLRNDLSLLQITEEGILLED